MVSFLLLLALLVPARATAIPVSANVPGAVWPVSGVVADDRFDGVLETFLRPACRWCPGRRGVWLAVPSTGAEVLAPWRGSVTFAGAVAGSLYVTIRLPSGALVTCGGLIAVALGLAPGVEVERGAVLGAASERLFLSVRRDGVHIEPLTALGWVRPRLVESATVGSIGPSR
jgi:hypothetical protein